MYMSSLMTGILYINVLLIVWANCIDILTNNLQIHFVARNQRDTCKLERKIMIHCNSPLIQRESPALDPNIHPVLFDDNMGGARSLS